MVLRARHDAYGLAVHKGEHGDLATRHELLNDHLVAGGAELPLQHHFPQSLFGRLAGLANQNALSERRTVRLEHHRNLAGLEIALCRLVVRKALVSCRRNLILFHEFLRESLGALKNRRVFLRPEDLESRFFQKVCESADQRIVHADHNKINLLPQGKVSDFFEFHRADRHQFRDFRDAGIARRAVEFREPSALPQFPANRMFSATAADYQYSHALSPLSLASRAISSMARGNKIHSASSMTRRCKVSGVSPGFTSTAF